LSSMLAEKYAHMLTRTDIIHLFGRLEETVGNRSQAARICGLERRTIYGWDTTREIRSRTRERILAVLLENLTEETLEFLTRRSVESSTDVLYTYLSSMYEKAMSEGTDNQEFSRLATRFDQTKQQYEGLLAGTLQNEISAMLQHTLVRAKEIGLAFRPLPNDIVRLTEFCRLIPDIVKAVATLSPYVPHNEIAKIFNLPAGFINVLSAALHDSYIPIRAVEPTQMVQVFPRDQTPTMATLTAGGAEGEGVWHEQAIPCLTPRLGGAT